MAFTGVITTTEGANFILDAAQGKTAGLSYYLLLFTNNYTPVITDTGATFPAAAGELTTQYNEATRPLFNSAAASAGISSNTANKAVVTINTEVTVYGAALITTSAKGNTSGKLIAAGKYVPAKNYVANDQPTFDISMFKQ